MGRIHSSRNRSRSVDRVVQRWDVVVLRTLASYRELCAADSTIDPRPDAVFRPGSSASLARLEHRYERGDRAGRREHARELAFFMAREAETDWHVDKMLGRDHYASASDGG
jgi:hypothetical protein